MALITRADWGAAAPRGTGNPLGKPKGVAVHWEGPAMGTRPHDECAAKVRGIQAFHQDARGWSDIAYNFIVCEHGGVFEGRGVNRGSAANGSTQANLDYHAICAMVGEGDAQPQPLLDGIKEARQICLDAGVGTAVVGHRDLYQTACPGDSLYAEVRKGTFSSVPARVVKVISRSVNAVRKAISVTPVLQQGSSGAIVRRLQAGLNRVFPSYSRLVVDGDFGPATAAVVREFQRRSRLAADGVVGPNTRAALKRCGVTY